MHVTYIELYERDSSKWKIAAFVDVKLLYHLYKQRPPYAGTQQTYYIPNTQEVPTIILRGRCTT